MRPPKSTPATRRVVTIATLSLLVLSLLPATTATAPYDDFADHAADAIVAKRRNPHPPILIDGAVDGLGVTLGEPASDTVKYRPGSGVRAGQGTASAPYFILGWTIQNGPSDALHGIHIRNTDAHIVVALNSVLGPPTAFGVPIPNGAGIFVEHAPNVSVHQNAVIGHSYGVVVEDTPGARVQGNNVQYNGVGVRVHASPDAQVVGNTVKRGTGNLGVTVLDEGYILRYTAGDGHGVVVTDSHGVRVAGNVVRNNPENGIHVATSDGFTVADNDVRNNRREGILIDHTEGGLVARNDVIGNSHNVRSWPHGGIRVADAANTTVRDNFLDDNFRTGVLVERSQGVVLEGNDLRQHQSDSARVVDSSGVTAHNNTLRGALAFRGADNSTARDNLLLGRLVFSGGADNVATGNLIQASGAIELRGTTRTVAVDNAAEDCGHNPFYVVGGQGALVANNTVTACQSGVLLNGAEGALVTGNVITDTDDWGIRIWGGDGNALDGNTVSGHGQDGSVTSGIEVTDSRNGTVTRNNIINGTGSGILGAPGVTIQRSSDFIVEANTLNSNGRYGLNILWSQGVTVANNTVAENRAQGVNVLDGDNLTITGNTVRDNHDHGVELYGRLSDEVNENVTISGNTIRGNNANGVRVDGPSSDVAITENLIRGNGAGVVVFDTDPVLIRHNNLEANGNGVKSTWALTDATDNWWGCPDGPDHPDCDGASGDVTYDPWLTAAWPDAGA